MNNTKNNVALVVHACDRYELLFKGFNHFFEKNWDFNIPVNYYFITEELKVDFPNFENINSGKGEWSDRLKLSLEQLKEKYILFIQEDMWFEKQVSSDFFLPLFDFIEKGNIPLFKLHSSDTYVTLPGNKFIDGFNIALLDNRKSDFFMSHQISVWDRNFLINQLHKNEHPWRNERKGSKRIQKMNPSIYHSDYFSFNNSIALNPNKENFKQSAYQTISVNATLNSNAKPFIDELISNNNESTSNYGKILLKHYSQSITHDGKSKPRKVGVIKKIKNLIMKIKD